MTGKTANPASIVSMPANASEMIDRVTSMPSRESMRTCRTIPTADPAGNALLAALPASWGAATSRQPSVRSTSLWSAHAETNAASSHANAITTHELLALRTEPSAAYT